LLVYREYNGVGLDRKDNPVQNFNTIDHLKDYILKRFNDKGIYISNKNNILIGNYVGRRYVYIRPEDLDSASMENFIVNYNGNKEWDFYNNKYACIGTVE